MEGRLGSEGHGLHSIVHVSVVHVAQDNTGAQDGDVIQLATSGERVPVGASTLAEGGDDVLVVGYDVGLSRDELSNRCWVRWSIGYDVDDVLVEQVVP